MKTTTGVFLLLVLALLGGCQPYQTMARMSPADVADAVAECRDHGLVDSYDADRFGVITVYCIPKSQACGQAVTP